MDGIENTLSSFHAPLVLDVATGRGGFARHLRESYGGVGKIVGIDVSMAGLNRSAEALSLIGDLAVVCMDSSEMAFRDCTFGMVCISNSMHHLDHLRGTLQEMLRVLRRGGLILLCEMYRDGQTPAQMTHVLLHDWWAEIDVLRGVPHYRTYSRKELLEIAAGLSLSEIIVEDSSFLQHDPHDSDVADQIMASIDAYSEKVKEVDGNPELLARGDDLRKRLREVGFHGATTLRILGRKPL